MKSRAEIHAAVAQAIDERLAARKLPAAVLSDETALTEQGLGLDSLDVVELWLELEERLSLKLPEADVRAVKTFGELVSLIEAIQQDTPET